MALTLCPALCQMPGLYSITQSSQQPSELGVYSSPIAVVINYHKLSGLEHHKFIILQLWISEVLTSTCQQSCIPSGSSKGD